MRASPKMPLSVRASLRKLSMTSVRAFMVEPHQCDTKEADGQNVMPGRFVAGLFSVGAAGRFYSFLSTGRLLQTAVGTLVHTKTVDMEVRKGNASKDTLLDAASWTVWWHIWLLLFWHQYSVVFFRSQLISVGYILVIFADLISGGRCNFWRQVDWRRK